MVTISNIANAVCSASKASNNPIKLSYSNELVAAFLGYKSFAAYQASKEECKALEQANHFFVDDDVLSSRLQSLKLSHTTSEVIEFLQGAFTDRLPRAHLHMSEDSMNDYLYSLVNDVVLNNNETINAMTMANNDGIDEIYLPIDEFVLADLPLISESLELSVQGYVSVEIDIERPYSGHKVDVEARLILERKGRRSIAEPICEVDKAALDFNW